LNSANLIHERKPLVSVGIPAFNGEKYLSEAIQSVLNQNYENFELIVVDDASQDQTLKIARSFKDVRIRTFANSNRLGLVKNWNECLKNARGDFFCILGQDDVMEADNLREKVASMLETPSAGMVYSKVLEIDECGTDFRYFEQRNENVSKVEKGRAFFERIFRENFVCSSSVVIRRACLERIGGFDARLNFACDWEMWMRISLHSDVIYSAAPLTRVRYHSLNESKRYAGYEGIRERWLARRFIYEKYGKSVDFPPQCLRELKRETVKACLENAEALFYEKGDREARKCLFLALRLEPLIFLINPRVSILSVKFFLGQKNIDRLRNN
jgi:glycosyltransferase involved in cell wall biosynthesis